jgi:4'-phosphopantetheinyl transferase EntD
VVTLGVDAEPDRGLPAEVLELVTRPDERDRLRRLARDAPGPCWDTLLFSAKESVYKAWFPLARQWLGFDEADVTIDAANGTFAARLLIAPPPSSGVPPAGFSGRWLARDGLLLTAISVLA